MSEVDKDLLMKAFPMDDSISKDKRDKVSLLDKSRLVKAYDDGEDYMDLGEKMGIKRNTVQSIIRLWRKCGLLSKGKQGGYKKPVISEEVGRQLVTLVESRPLCPLKDMKAFLAEFNIFPTEQTISNFLHGKCIAITESRKPMPPPQDLLLARERFVMEIGDLLHTNCVYIDEFLFNFWMKRAYGRTQKAERVYRHCCGQKGTNVTVLVAVGNSGVRLHKVFTSPVTDADFGEFLMQLSMKVGRHNRLLFVHDGAHPATISPCDNHRLVVMPPASHELNPARAFHCAFKASLMGAMPPQQDVVKLGLIARKELLHAKISQALAHTHYSFAQYFADSQLLHKLCLAKQDLPHAS